MVGAIEIKAAYESAKAALQIAQGIGSLKTEAAVNSAIIELQRHTVDAQRGLSASLHRIDELEKEVERLEDWTAEKQRYHLKAITPRAYAYVVKPGVETADDPHWLCQKCFDEGHKIALQWAGKTVSPPYISGSFASWYCPRCSSEVHVGRNQSPTRPDDGEAPPSPKPINYPKGGIV